MQNIDWTDVHYCLAVIKQGSVTAAARALGVNHTTVSRRISALEATLEAPLFDRSNAGWSITPVAESILPNLEQMQEAASAIERSVSADRKELSGTIRVTAIDIFIQRVIMPGLKAFTEQYPHINLELLASDETLNLSVHAADIAFRMTNEPPLDVVGKKIANLAYGVYTSRELWQKYEQGDRNIGAITWMLDGSTVPGWLPQSYPDMDVRYRSNSFNVIFDLIQQGHGFGELPCALGDSHPELVRVPASGTMEANGLWILSHIDLRTTARIRIFRDFMLDYLEPLIPELEGDGPVAGLSTPMLKAK